MNNKRMAMDTLIYLPAKVVEGFISIFTLSYLTGLFNSAVYGQFSSINVTIGFVNVILFSWLSNCASRYTGNYLLEGDWEKKSTFLSTIGTVFLITAAVLTAGFGAYALFSASLLPLLILLMLLGFAAFQILSAILVQTGKRFAYTAISISNAAGKLLVAWVFGASGLLSLQSPMVALIAYAITDIICSVVAACICGFPAFFSVKKASKAIAKQFFKYGFPLIGVGFSVALLNQAYRYIIQFFAGNEAFGIFSANSTIAASVFNMLMIGIMRAVYPSILKAHREEGTAGASQMISQGARLYMLLALPSAAGITALSGLISRIVLDYDKYGAGIPIIGFTAFGMFFLGLTEYSNKAWELGGNTKPVLRNSLLSAAANIALNLITIPRFGFLMAGVNMLVSYGMYFVLSYTQGRKIIALKLPFHTIFSIVLASLLCGLAAFGCTLLPIGLIAQAILGILSGIAVYGGVLVLSGELKNEIAQIKRKIM